MIAAIEEAIKARIAGAGLGYLRTVATYGGQFDEGLAEVVRAFPAVWVALKGEDAGKATGTSREVWHVPVTFLVMVGARSVQNEAAARKGGLTVGTYQMLADVRAVLLMQDFSLPIDPLRPGRTHALFTGKVRSQGLSIIAQEWSTKYPLEVRLAERVPRYSYPVDENGGAFPPGQPGQTGKPGASGPPVHADGTTLPPLPPLPELAGIGLNYYLRPPRAADDEPDMQDNLTLQGDLP